MIFALSLHWLITLLQVFVPLAVPLLLFDADLQKVLRRVNGGCGRETGK